MKLSKSQLTCFNASKSQRAGRYILRIQDIIENDSLGLGQLAEHRLITKQDDYTILENANIQDMEKTISEYDNIKHNAYGLKIPQGQVQAKVEGELLGQLFVGYIDILTEDTVVDIKTSKYLTNTESESKNMWSGLSSYEEYELQLWIYMSLTGRKKGQIIEVSKHKYKDERNAHQVIDFERSDDRNKNMTKKRQPVVDEMVALYNKYSK